MARILGVVVLAALFTPEAFDRNVHYWINVLSGAQTLAGLPAYHLPVNAVPGWVLQTREFYGLVNLDSANLSVLLQGAVLPALLIGLIALTAWRNRLVRVMVAVAAGASVLAYYTAAGQACSYCVQRNMIPVVALAVPAVALGLVTVAALRYRGAPALAVLAAAVFVVIVGRESVVEHQRLANGSYLLDPQVRQTLAALPAQAGPVDLEGFSESVLLAPMEEVQVYDLVNEKTHQNVSLPTTANDGQGLFYFGGATPLGPSFRANYQYVLTRLPGIKTQRHTVARHGSIALQRRTHDLDVTITAGVSVPAVAQDPTGTAWVRGPMQFLVAGGQTGVPAWVSLVFERTVPVTVLANPTLAGVRRHGSELDVCLRVVGSPPVRGLGLQLGFTPQAPPAVTQPFAGGLPARGVRLVSMGVSSTNCGSRAGGKHGG